jgi:hypothetical protein
MEEVIHPNGPLARPRYAARFTFTGVVHGVADPAVTVDHRRGVYRFRHVEPQHQLDTRLQRRYQASRTNARYQR